MHRLYWTVMLILALSVLSGSVRAEVPTAEIILEAISPRDIVLMELPEGTQATSGLPVVGVGTPVYLKAGGTDPDEGQITIADWTLSAKPSGSAAALVEGPADMMTLLPDVTGQYTIELVVTDDQGEASAPATQVITAGTWVGVGTVGDATPDVGKGQCGTCHADKVTDWEKTGHASMLERGVDGTVSSHYGERCISCHTVGYNTSETAVNDGFDDRATALGWTFPEELKEGNWEALPAELKEVSNIQCENCHGPGSEHKGDKTKIATSMDPGACAVCHDSGTHHVFPYEWAVSKHAVATSYPTGEGREACVQCHSGIGFAEYASMGQAESVEYAPITCASCHDPHSVENVHQLRKLDDVPLGNGEVVRFGGLGKLCMNCHKSRRNAEEYVTEYHPHYGPHHGPQADMLAGTNAIEYGKRIPSSMHKDVVEDGCVTCHMAPTPGKEEPGQYRVGAHSFAMSWDGDTPEDSSDDVENVNAACNSCHVGLESFDRPAAADFDGDGTVEGVQTEVKGLMAKLALALPPVGEPEVKVDENYTPEQLKAAYNYLFVEEDKSFGIHNTKYAVGILQAAIEDLTGEAIAVAETKYVGSEVCGTCHREKYESWKETLHKRSLRNIVDPTSPDYQDPSDPRWGVIGDFSQDPTLSGGGVSGVTVDLNESDGVYTAKIGDTTYRVVRTYGGGSGWKQRYQTKIGNSFYILPMQWNEKTGEWVAYHLQDWYSADGTAKTISKAQSFERRCAGCHNTGLEVSYREETGEYTSAFKELNTGCERCHGSGAEHVAAGGGVGVSIVNPEKLDAARANEVCGQCHSRGASVDAMGPKTLGYPWRADKGAFTPGETLTEYYTDRGGDWPDGKTSKKHHQQLFDLYESSKPTFRFHKVTCFECHDPHGSSNKHMVRASVEEEEEGQTLAIATQNDDNTLCLSCHATHGPFAALTKAMIADVAANRDAIAEVVIQHTYHSYDPENGPSRCSKCHMPKVAKSAVEYDIHSHTFEAIPPGKTLDYQTQGGMPNSCAVSCHRSGAGGAPTFGIVDATLAKWDEPSDVALANVLLKYFGPVGRWWKSEAGARPGYVAGLDNIPPAGVASVLAQDTPEDTGGSITVRWTKSEDDKVISAYPFGGQTVLIRGVEKYNVYRRTGTDAFRLIHSAAPGETLFVDTGLQNGVRYTYTVRAADRDNETPGPIAYAVAQDNRVPRTETGEEIKGLFPGVDDTPNRVDLGDFLALVSNFGSAEAAYDLDEDGVVGLGDFLIFVQNFGKVAVNLPAAKAVSPGIGLNPEARVLLMSQDGVLRAGGEIVVSAALMNAREVAGYGFTVAYDPEWFEFLRADGRAISERPGHVTVASASSTGHESIVDLHFRVMRDSEGPAIFEVVEAMLLDRAGVFSRLRPSGVLEIAATPTEYALSNYPNPFNPITHIGYSLPEDGAVRLMVCDALGQMVRELVNGPQKAGRHTAMWDGKDGAGNDVATGIYFYRLESKDFRATRKMALIR